ncbi:hypothetical protein [Kitasatospora sp. NPDC094016]|uniref:hypothetical protein n=1 Tax=unclassified Kitasatospora TaxID=2633591 RepID=UPI00331713D7
MTGPSKFERQRLPAGWSPLDDYRAASAAERAPSVGTLLQVDAVRSTCVCPNCTTRRADLSA